MTQLMPEGQPYLMSKPAVCPIHGIQNFEGFTPKIANAIREGTQIDPRELKEVIVESEYGIRRIKIDDNICKELFGGNCQEKLIGRDKQKKLMNDRLKIMDLMKRLEYACPECAKVAMGET